VRVVGEHSLDGEEIALTPRPLVPCDAMHHVVTIHADIMTARVAADPRTATI